jgi:hypothetical protein
VINQRSLVHSPNENAFYNKKGGRKINERRFLVIFLLTVLGGFLTFVLLHLMLAKYGLLPPPPLTATSCIDSKLVELRGRRLEDRTLVAIGSSATWRNLDMSVFEHRFPATSAYNIAPCYLHIDQTNYFAGFMLQRMPLVQTVIVVVAPRDFEVCAPEQNAIFDMRLATAVLSELAPSWIPYITGFRPLYLAREAIKQWQISRQKAPELAEADPAPFVDQYGSSVLIRAHPWRPAPVIDQRCFAGLTALETTVMGRGANLIVATVPVMPEWAAMFDADGSIIETWTKRMAASLKSQSSLFIDGRKLQWDNSFFADPVHIIYPHHTIYSEFIADAMADRKTATNPTE